MASLPFGERWRVMFYGQAGTLNAAVVTSLESALDIASACREATLITIWKVGTEPAPVVHHAAHKGEAK